MTTIEFLRTGWIIDPFTAALCGTLVSGYAFLRLRSKPGAQSGTSKELFCFAAALVVLLMALVSPIAVLARRYLFSAHMLQHLLLLLVIPPLLLMSLPKLKNKNSRHPVRQFAGLTWICSIGAMALWHEPGLCSAAGTSIGLFHLQTLSLLGAGTLFWWPIVGPRAADRIAPLAGIVYLFSACLACTLLGIYITFAPSSVCPVFLHAQDSNGILSLVRNRWGINPEADQRTGGLMMWVPACLVYLTGILGLLTRWYAGEDVELEAADPLSKPAPTQI